jgi:hypothetical protein
MAVAGPRPAEPPSFSGLPVMTPGSRWRHERFIFIQHPGHDLGVGVYIGRGHILGQANIAGDVAHIGSAEPLQFAGRHLAGIADDAAFGTAQGDVGHGRLPGHPGGQGPDGIDGLIGVEAEPPFVGPRASLYCTRKAAESLGPAVVHAHRNAEMEFTHRFAQEFMHGRIELENGRCLVQLSLGNGKRIEIFSHEYCSFFSVGNSPNLLASF